MYYQLGPERIVRVDRDGWEVDHDPPVVFRSVPNLKRLPDPEEGGTLDTLEDLINLKSERDTRMCKVYAATLPLAHIPRPILQTTGVMGSGKTTAGRIRRSESPMSCAHRATPSHSEFASQLGFVRQRIQPLRPCVSNSQTRPRTR